MSDYENHPLTGVRSHYFTGPRSSANGYKTLPTLLREVAEWLEVNDVDDADFCEMTTHTSFESDNDDESYETITVYYREDD